MSHAFEPFSALCAASLLGYLAGWPLGAWGPRKGHTMRMFVGALAAGTAALLAAGHAPGAAVLAGLVGAALAVGADDLVARAPLAVRHADAPVRRDALPSGGDALSSGDDAPPAGDDALTAGDDAVHAEIFDPRSRRSDRILAPDVVSHGCRRCSTENAADARYCRKCSAPLVPWTCESCRRTNPVDATFCEGCREPLPMLVSPLEVEVGDG